MSRGQGHRLRFDVYGLPLEIERDGERWRAYRLGEGKRRELHDLVIPAELPEAGLERFLGDVCHELATPERPRVVRLATRGSARLDRAGALSDN